MNELPAAPSVDIDISVLFITYNRSELLELTLRAVRERVDFCDLRVEFIVTDNASDEPHLSRILAMPFDKHALSPVNRGLGNNCNKGIAQSRGLYILQIQDDCEYVGASTAVLTALRVMEEDRDIGIVQLIDHTPHLPHEIRYLRDGLPYRVFINDGIRARGTSGRRPYSDQPHLKRRQFYDDIGPYPEGTTMSDMEIEYQQRVACQTRWRVATIPHTAIFQHLGIDRSFNTGTARAQRLARLEAMPIVGGIFRRVRPLLRRMRDRMSELRV